MKKIEIMGCGYIRSADGNYVYAGGLRGLRV